MEPRDHRSRKPLAGLLLIVGLLGMLITTVASAQPRCFNEKNRVSPGRLLNNLDLAVRGQATECDWAAEVAPGFPNSMGGGSYNIPVIAAAIALVKEPVRSGSWNMYTWWDTYLRGELGMRGSVWNYGGKELGSSIYQHFNIVSVLVVHYEAWRTNRTSLRNLAREWLQATFAIHALAATPARPTTIHDRTFVEQVPGGYTGPWIALAGMRSNADSWKRSARAMLFARATGLGTNLAGEPGNQKRIRQWIEARWNGPGGNVYGLDGTDRQHLRNVLGQASVSSRVTAMLDGIHTITRLHFVRWGGKRLTLMERNHHGSTVPTYGMIYYPNGEAHVLHPWIRTKDRQGVTAGKARLYLSSRMMVADNFPQTSGVHGQITSTIGNLPAAPPSYHIILEP